jgi:signal transduction histidine kinase
MSVSDVLALHQQELRRIANEIHDDPIQVLAVAVMRLDIVAARIDDDETATKLRDARAAVSTAMDHLRTIQYALDPPALEREGLAAALADDARRCFDDAAVVVDVNLDAEPSLLTRALVFRVAHDLFVHAPATPVELRVRLEGNGVVLHAAFAGRTDVADEEVSPSAAALTRSVGGRWSIQSGSTDGTTVECWLPGV